MGVYVFVIASHLRETHGYKRFAAVENLWVDKVIE